MMADDPNNEKVDRNEPVPATRSPKGSHDLSSSDDEAPRKRRRSHKHKKSRRRRRHSSSDPDESDHRPREDKTHGHRQVSDSDEGDFSGFSDFPPNCPTVSKGPKVNSLPWMNANVPPGPWQMYPMSMMPMSAMMQPFPCGNFWQGYPPDQVPSSDEEKPSTSTAAELPASAAPELAPALSKHLQAMSGDEEIGPAIDANLANLMEKVWNKTHREELKTLYEANKRPKNTPSLERVTLDQDLAAGISGKSKAKRTDVTLNSANVAIVKSAIALTKLADRALSCEDLDKLRQDTIDSIMDSMKMLAHANSQIHNARREQFKSLMDPGLIQQLTKSKSLESTNASHQLFGGDLQKQAKEGQYNYDC